MEGSYEEEMDGVGRDGRSDRSFPAGGSDAIGTGCCSWDFGSLVRGRGSNPEYTYTCRRNTKLIPSKPHAHHHKEASRSLPRGAERANGKRTRPNTKSHGLPSQYASHRAIGGAGGWIKYTTACRREAAASNSLVPSWVMEAKEEVSPMRRGKIFPSLSL